MGGESYFGKPTLMLLDHNMVKDIFKDYNNYIKQPPFSGVVFHLIGKENLVWTNGESWKSQRTLINPIFGKLTVFFDMIDKKCDQVIDSWDKRLGESYYCIGDDFQKMTLDILGSCIFGKDFNFFLLEKRKDLCMSIILFSKIFKMGLIFF